MSWQLISMMTLHAEIWFFNVLETLHSMTNRLFEQRCHLSLSDMATQLLKLIADF